ncbi:gamma-glutamyltransferase [Pusillimonas sp. MFBS29]|uniref:gamma-glutamyltransferase n=1 Tax=Pusillimonas sp. MFBS29 TaxID=2886690 RepID=UPI001D126829|nr:gamma-glutamyltransferase [Pusillimonas sp. MFBS29]MCC2594914.1 gamma-glutamyltransferase [Pusillimonas sp. MFBS29]
MNSVQARFKGLLMAVALLCVWPAARGADIPALLLRGDPGQGGVLAKEDTQPEIATGRQRSQAAYAEHYMVSSANPLATGAGVDILAQGGSAADAIIAAQMVLTLVEPQSSGIGGGAFLVGYDAQTQKVQAYDGRETAPATARGNRFMLGGEAINFKSAVNSGLSVGTPGVLRMLEQIHNEHGKLPWAQLFEPAIHMAEHGFAVSPRLHHMLVDDVELRRQKASAAYFYDDKGQAWPVGHILKNPALAQTLRELAERGADAFYSGRIANDIVQAVAAHVVPGDLSMDDLAGYRALEREPLCAPYKVYVLCGAPPPSSGPLAIIQMLTMLSHTPIATLAPESAGAIHYFSEAGRLAFADRAMYVADPAFAKVPVEALLDPRYLSLRADLIMPKRSIGRAPAGDPLGMLAVLGADASPELPSTTHVVVVDSDGDVMSMTSSIESAFGSKIFVDGFLLNNQLTDFSLSDVDADDKPILNRVEPGKRPRSSMSPMLVLKDGKPYMALGSPGGASIVNYVAKVLLGVLDWDMSMQEAIDFPNFGSRNLYTDLEKSTSLRGVADELRMMGHEVRQIDFPSGVQAVRLLPGKLEGGADPRREGLAAGD